MKCPVKLPPHQMTVYRAMSTARWRTGYEVQARIIDGSGIYTSESSVTRRIREIREKGVPVEMRRRHNSTAFEYRLGKDQ